MRTNIRSSHQFLLLEFLFIGSNASGSVGVVEIDFAAKCVSSVCALACRTIADLPIINVYNYHLVIKMHAERIIELTFIEMVSFTSAN